MRDYNGMKRCRLCVWLRRGDKPLTNDAKYICVQLGPYHKRKANDYCRYGFRGGILPEAYVDLEVVNV